jgi:hypothetical protein
MSSIVSKSWKPRAIAKEKNGIVLYWVEELGAAGLNLKGLARLLEYDHGSLGKFLKGVEQKPLLQAEVVTDGGLQGVELYDGEALSEILVEIISSNINKSTRVRAKIELKRLAAAGFSLMVMMELAPAELAVRAVSHLDKEIELEQIKNEGRALEAQIASSEHQKALAETNLLAFRHLVTTTMPEVKQQIILGFDIVEKIEYRDRVIQNNQVLDDGETINKTALCDRYDIKTRSGSPDYKRLNALLDGAKLPNQAWEETTTIRSNLQLRREYLENLDRHIKGTTQQMHLGER